MNSELNLTDIADDLLILNRQTIESLFRLENAGDCIALYVMLYRTAKWQGTSSVRANDSYIRKCLGWGSKKALTTKKLLAGAGLIKQVARRDEAGKIVGHYIEISYFLSQNTQKQHVALATSGERETSAYKNNISTNKNNKIGGEPQCEAVEKSEKTEYGNHEVNALIELWEHETGLTANVGKANRLAAYNLIRKKGFEGAKAVVELVGRAIKSGDQYAPRVSSFRDLQGQYEKLSKLEAWEARQSVPVQAEPLKQGVSMSYYDRGSEEVVEKSDEMRQRVAEQMREARKRLGFSKGGAR